MTNPNLTDINSATNSNDLLVQLPRIGGINDNLVRVTEQTRTRERPINTQKAYDCKNTELIQYLRYAWAHDDFHLKLDHHKVYHFIFYQCAREKRSSRRGQRGRQQPNFDAADYDNIMAKYDFNNVQSTVTFIQPQNGLQLQALRQYKAVLKEYFDKQRSHHTQGWEFVWTRECTTLMNIVKSRGAEQKLRNIDEKVSHALSPFTIVHRYPEIEEKLFHQGMSNMRVAVSQLRNRYVLTHTTSGILRFETLEKACLSDFLCSVIQKDEDVHPLLVMITQVFTGKGNLTL
jgi:hypothetical protein